MHEKEIELFILFQEKLALKFNDSDFRSSFLEPLLYSGVTEQALDLIIENVLQDPEVTEMVKNFEQAKVKTNLKTLLKKLIERISKFYPETNSDYIG